MWDHILIRASTRREVSIHEFKIQIIVLIKPGSPDFKTILGYLLREKGPQSKNGLYICIELGVSKASEPHKLTSSDARGCDSEKDKFEELR